MSNDTPNLPAAPTEADDGRNETWEPESFPETIAGEIVARAALKFRQPRGERETFEKLVVQKPDGELVDVLCGRARLARLVVKHDPRPGDLVAITAFGTDEKGWHEYGLNVDKTARFEQDKLVEEASSEEALFGEEEAA